MPIVDEMLLGNFYLCSKKNTEVTKGLIQDYREQS